MSGTAQRRIPMVTILVAGTVLCALVAGIVLLACSGWSIFMITTPSMSTAAPVGSLVITHPEAAYHVGQIISFHLDGRTITHRIEAIAADGITTKGDLNGVADSWTVKPANVIGVAQWIAPGLGWVLKGLPWLILGAAVTEAIVRFARLRRDWVWAVRLFAWAVTVTLVSVWLRPWFNVELLDFRPADDGNGMLMHIVNTGLLALAAVSTRFTSGQDVVVNATQRSEQGFYLLTPTPALSFLESAALIVVCLLPVVISFFISRRVAVDGVGEVGDSGAMSSRRETVILAAIAVAAVVGVSVVTTLSTGAAFAATIKNSTDTAGTNGAFTCQQAETKFGANPYAIYGLGKAAVKNETDLSGKKRTGKYAVSTVISTGYGCARDTPKASVTFNGTSQCLSVPGKLASPNTFTLEAWFRTSTTANGRIIGFGNAASGAGDSSYDRLVYVAPSGRIFFGVNPAGSTVTIATPPGTSYADGNWHQVVATLSNAGMALYVDGALAGSNPSITTGRAFTGYWKIGCGKLSGWASTPGTGDTSYGGPSYFTGQIQYAAIYLSALTAAQVKTHYLAGVVG